MKQKQSKSQVQAVSKFEDNFDAEQAPQAIALSPEEVARRAYAAYEDGGREDGHDVEHWLNAESRLSAENTF